MILISGPEQIARHLQWLQQFNGERVGNAVLEWAFSQLAKCACGMMMVQRKTKQNIRQPLNCNLFQLSTADPREVYWAVTWSNVIHVLSAGLGLVGTLKVNKLRKGIKMKCKITNEINLSLQLIRPLIGQFIVVHMLKLTFATAYLVTNLVLLKKQINLGLLILTILVEGLAMGKFQ